MVGDGRVSGKWPNVRCCVLFAFVLLLLSFNSVALASYKTYDGSIETYQDFRNGTNNTIGYDADGSYGRQCWDGVQVFYQRLGMRLSTGGQTYVKYCWANESARSANTGTQFTQITRIEDVKRGDVMVFSGPASTGHIGFADEDNNPESDTISVWGQNQEYHYNQSLDCYEWHFTTADIRKSYFLGAFRYNGWVEKRGSVMNSGYDRVLPDGNYYIACASDPNFFLDILGSETRAGNGTNVQLWSTSSDIGDVDAWTIKYSNGFYTISQYNQSVYLDVPGSDTLHGKNVQVWETVGSAGQQWAISKSGNNGYRIQARCSGYSLDVENDTHVNYTNVRVWEGNDSAAQKWVFIPYKPSQPISAGRYILVSAMDESVELDVVGNTGEINNGANVQIWHDDTPSEFNSFDLVPLSNGYYHIIHAASGKYLDIDSPSGWAIDGANAELWDKNDLWNQQWAIIKNGAGYSLILRYSGFALDVEGSSTANGANVSQYSRHGDNNQIWSFVQAEHTVSYNANGGTSTPDNQTKYYKRDLTITNKKPIRSGYTFVNWQGIVNGNTVVLSPGEIYTYDQNIVLTAMWEESSYDVNFSLNEVGTVNKWFKAPEAQKVTSGSIVLPELLDGRFTYELGSYPSLSHNFIGWSTDSTAMEAEYQPGDTCIVNNNMTFYAVWQIKQMTLLIDLTGPTLISLDTHERKTINADWGSVVDIPIPQNEGKLFKTWKIYSRTGFEDYSATTWTATKNLTLYADWQELNTMRLPSVLTTIEEDAFRNTLSNAIVIPDTVRVIEAGAFADNEELYIATIYSRDVVISDTAFSNCPNLTIRGYRDTGSQWFATARDIPFEPLNEGE